MMEFSDKYYQTLCPADKRKILQDLAKLLSDLYGAYGKISGSKNAVKFLIGSHQEIIKKFVGLMQNEVSPYNILGEEKAEKAIQSLSASDNEPSAVRNTTGTQATSSSSDEVKSAENQSVINEKTDLQSETPKQGEVFLSNAVKTYIDSVIQDTVSNQFNEKIKPILECLNQYEEEIRVYKEREAKHQEENEDIHPDKNGCMTTSRKNSGLMDSLPDNIQKQIRIALNIYNENSASDNFVIRRRLKKALDKPIVRLVLPHDDANEFANKPIKDLKNDKTYQLVFLESTDGSNDYIATPVGENVYAVFPVKFEPYNQSFAWKRAYPLFFDILPNDEMEASRYILKQPAFFQKNGDKYQMIEGGKGRIELEK